MNGNGGNGILGFQQLAAHVAGLTRSFNAFVQQAGADIGALKQTLAQVIAGHNQLDKAMEQLAARSVAMEQGMRQLAVLAAQSGAGAVVVGAQGGAPGAQTVDGSASPGVAGMPPIVVPSASGATLETPNTLSDEDKKIFFGGGEDG